MATRNQRRRRAAEKKAAILAARDAILHSGETAVIVKANRRLPKGTRLVDTGLVKLPSKDKILSGAKPKPVIRLERHPDTFYRIPSSVTLCKQGVEQRVGVSKAARALWDDRDRLRIEKTPSSFKTGRWYRRRKLDPG